MARILDQRSSGDGMSSVPRDGFAGVLTKACADWVEARGQLPVLLSGMVGSRQGWVEAPYAATPAGRPELASGLISIDVPGFKSVPHRAGDHVHRRRRHPGRDAGRRMSDHGRDGADGAVRRDVRDARHALEMGDGCWRPDRRFPHVHDRRDFRGPERTHDPRADDDANRGRRFDRRQCRAFAQGVETASRSVAPGEWLHRLFSVRTLGLMGKLADAQTRLTICPA